MSTTYTIKAGDTISQVAQEHGFQNWELVWNDAANGSLRASRARPELIEPGDELTIPDRTTKKVKVSATIPAKFQLAAVPSLAVFSLTIADRKGDANDGLDVELRRPGASSEVLTTDSAGLIEIKDPSLTSGEVEIVSIPNKRKVADRIAATAGVARRSTWGAAKPKIELDPDWDFDTVVIHHSGDGGEKSAKKIQAKHFSSGYDDIAYEYVVKLNGRILEGRHIAFKSAGNSQHNTKKIAIIVAGDFEHQWWDDDDDPTEAALNAMAKLVNVLKGEFPLTKLVGHRDLPRAKGDTDCPGEELYKLLGAVRAKTGLAGS